jgi:hypothetical protein
MFHVGDILKGVGKGVCVNVGRNISVDANEKVLNDKANFWKTARRLIADPSILVYLHERGALGALASSGRPQLHMQPPSKLSRASSGSLHTASILDTVTYMVPKALFCRRL